MTLYAHSIEQSREQGVLILAIAVSVAEDLRGCMGLISSNAQRNSDVVESRAHVIVNSVNFGFIVGAGFRKLGSLCPDFRGWFHPIFLQAVIPAPHFLPGTEAADLNVGWRKPSSYSLLQLFQLLVLLRFVLEFVLSLLLNSSITL